MPDPIPSALTPEEVAQLAAWTSSVTRTPAETRELAEHLITPETTPMQLLQTGHMLGRRFGQTIQELGEGTPLQQEIQAMIYGIVGRYVSRGIRGTLPAYSELPGIMG